MATVKVTQKDMFNAVINFINGEETNFSTDEMVDFLKGRIAVLDKKSANRKTKVNESDEELKTITLEAMASIGKPATVTTIMQNGEYPEGTSNQKVSAILRKLIADEVVLRERDKKSTLFSLVA
jgi:hypothetical protein